MRASRVALALALGALALNIIAFAGLERRSRALDGLQVELEQALATARDGSLIQYGEPPRGMLIFGFYYEDYGADVIDLYGAIGKWNGQSLIHTYIEGGKSVSYAVANEAPRAWYPIPADL